MRPPARRGHLEDRGDAIAQHPPLGVDLAPERIVHARMTHLAAGRAHESKRGPLSPIRER